MGHTYSRLGATLGGPKLRLLSDFCLFCFTFVSLLSVLSLCSLVGYLSTRSSPPACCCVPRPPKSPRESSPRLYGPLSVLARTLRHSPSLQKRSRNPRLPKPQQRL